MRTVFGMAIAATAAFSVAATSASAVTYDVASSYNGVNNPAGPFTFGYINLATTSFTAFSTANFASPCLGNAALSCITDGIEPALGVYKNMTGVPLNGVVSTIDVPANALFLHPGPTLIAAVAFTSPTTTIYNYSSFLRLLTNTSPTGVDLYVGFGTGLVLEFIDIGTSLPATLGASLSEAGPIPMTAGSTVFFGIGAGTDYRFDSTQFELTLTTVPEPANWAMLIAGFGLTGAMMRRRRAVAIAA